MNLVKKKILIHQPTSQTVRASRVGAAGDLCGRGSGDWLASGHRHPRSCVQTRVSRGHSQTAARPAVQRDCATSVKGKFVPFFLMKRIYSC